MHLTSVRCLQLQSSSQLSFRLSHSPPLDIWGIVAWQSRRRLQKTLFTTIRGGNSKVPDALDWENLFGPSKNLDKICLCQSFNLSSVGALRHSKIFVNHKYQPHGNEHHRLPAVSGNGYMWSQESWAHGDLQFNLFDRTCCLGILLLVF